jgi:CRP-like cAMP-binding protein
VSANFTSTPQNTLLATLPATEWGRAGRHFKPIFMPLGAVLYEPATAVNHIYFPTTSVTSISCVMNDGRADALTLIGREGFVGVELLLGSGSAPCRAVVLSEGWAYRIKREFLNEECERGGSMRSVLLRYAQSYITQVTQTTVCNQHHSIDQQLCRWLLMFLDCQASNELPLTHEHIAELMGVRRASVTEAARRLKIARYIRYHRGHFFVVDRTGLEARSCECYGIAKRETERLLQMSQQTVKERQLRQLSTESTPGVQGPPGRTRRQILPKGEVPCCDSPVGC